MRAALSHVRGFMTPIELEEVLLVQRVCGSFSALASSMVAHAMSRAASGWRRKLPLTSIERALSGLRETCRNASSSSRQVVTCMAAPWAVSSLTLAFS